METKEQGTLNRGEFLRSMGLSSSALMAFYCMGTTLTSCSTKDTDPLPTPPSGGTAGVTGRTTGGSIDFNIDLVAYKAKDLKKEGESDIFGDVIVIAVANKKYVALSKACTHQGTPVRFRGASNDILCPNHLSEFRLDGTVQRGPAASPLTVFKTALSADGNSLNVKA